VRSFLLANCWPIKSCLPGDRVTTMRIFAIYDSNSAYDASRTPSSICY
jgi:hypothetical protein